jgi:hypothetical protein
MISSILILCDRLDAVLIRVVEAESNATGLMLCALRTQRKSSILAHSFYQRIFKHMSASMLLYILNPEVTPANSGPTSSGISNL